MRVIVDANRIPLFLDPLDSDSSPLRRWIEKGRGLLVYCVEGKFETEISAKAKQKFATYRRDGKAVLVQQAKFRADEIALCGSGELSSDDPHVLALARATGARLLYTRDPGLIADFKNKRLIDAPRGKVYSRAKNAGLLTRQLCKWGAER